MWPIFNEKVTEKCNLWVHEQYTEVLFTEDLVNNCGLEKKKKKKKKENAKRKNVDAQTGNPNTHKKEELVGMGNEYDRWEEQRLSNDETSHWPWGPLCEGYYNIAILTQFL